MTHPDFAPIFQGFVSDTEAAAEQPLLAGIFSQIYLNENHSFRATIATPVGAGVKATLLKQEIPEQPDNICKKTRRKRAERLVGGCTIA